MLKDLTLIALALKAYTLEWYGAILVHLILGERERGVRSSRWVRSGLVGEFYGHQIQGRGRPDFYQNHTKIIINLIYYLKFLK